MRRKWFVACLILIGSILSCQKEGASTSYSTCPFFAWGFALDGFPITEDRLRELEKDTKVQAQLIEFYLQWPASPNHFDSIYSSLEAITHKGAIPCLTWEPMTIVNEKEQSISHKQILNGDYDVYLIGIAQEIKKANNPLIIRFAHEMNLKRYHWGTNEEEYGTHSPEIYIRLFRYVVNLFRQHEVHQVLWAFCPNVEPDPNETWNHVKNYYPGDEYVDLIGIDGYNWAINQEIANEKKQTWTKPWISFEELFYPMYQTLKTIAPSKPLIIFETAAVNRRDENKKSTWIKEALRTANQWGLAGIIWFQVKKEEDWRIQQDGDYSYVRSIQQATSPFHEWIFSRTDSKNVSKK